MTSPSISTYGKSSVSINNGDSVTVLTDNDGDGRMGKGDSYAVFAQGDRFGQGGAAVVSGVLGSGESMEGSGDPHLFSYQRSGEAEGVLTAQADRLYVDAKDNGVLDSTGGDAAFVSSLRQGATVNFVGDFHSDVRLTHLDGRTSIDFDVVLAEPGSKVAYTDNAVYRAKNGDVVEIKEVWSGNGGAGQMTASDGSTLTESQDLHVIHDMTGARVRVLSTEFSASTTGSRAAGTDGSYIIDGLNGVRHSNGVVTDDAINSNANYIDGLTIIKFMGSLTMPSDPRDDERQQRLRR
jgi:hypothetical protein